MDVRIADEQTQLRETIDRALAAVNTCIPGKIDSFNSATQTATVVPGIQMKLSIDGVESYIDLPPIIHAPVVFPFAATAGFALTLPVRQGDPCLILFSQRAIDNWHRLGGVRPPETGRHHDLTDALVLLAPSPLTSVLGSWEASGIELRNRTKTSRVTVKDASVEIANGDSIISVTTSKITITSASIELNGAVKVNGALLTSGAIESQTSLADPNGLVSAHKHNDPVSGQTSTPVY